MLQSCNISNFTTIVLYFESSTNKHKASSSRSRSRSRSSKNYSIVSDSLLCVSVCILISNKCWCINKYLHYFSFLPFSLPASLPPFVHSFIRSFVRWFDHSLAFLLPPSAFSLFFFLPRSLVRSLACLLACLLA